MLCSSQRIAITARLFALATVLALAAVPAEAQVKPFKISGSGIGPAGLPLPGQPPRPHSIVGEATHLGRHSGQGSVKTDSATFDPVAGRFTGQFGSGSPFVFTAANGDKLACHYGRTEFGASEPGRFELNIVGSHESGAPIVQALWIAEFVPQPNECTGRFAGVTGSWVMIAKSQPFVLGSDAPVFYSWEGSGRLMFTKGK